MAQKSEGTRLPIVLERLRTRATGRFLRDGDEDGIGLRESSRLDGSPQRWEAQNGGRKPGPEPGPRRRFLVTGCAGFIGSHVVDALLARGCSVTGVDAFIDNYPRPLKERNLMQCAGPDGLRFVELDLCEAPLEELLEGFDGIFHLAARPGVRTSWGNTFRFYVHDNLVATQRLFEEAAARGVRVVYASSSSVYGDAARFPVREDARLAPVSPYGMTKLACEVLAASYARSHGLDAVGLRYFTVYGPRQRPDMAFARMLQCQAENRPFHMLGTGRQTREFTYVGDVVDATLAAMSRAPAGRVYNVGGGTELSLVDAVAACERIVGRRLEVRRVTPVIGEPRRTCADIRRAEIELGWRPTISVERGLAAQARELEATRAEVAGV